MVYEIELQSVLDNFFSKWEKNLSGCNYVVDMGLKDLSHVGEKIRKEAILENMLGYKNGAEVEFIKATSQNLKGAVANFIVNANGYPPGHYTSNLKTDVRNKFIPKYFEFIKYKVSLENANIYQLKNLEDHPVFDIFWSYTFLVIDHNRGNSVLIWAGASD